MSSETIKINIPFDALLNSIAELDLEEKIQIRNSLDDQIDALEEERPEIEAEIQEAREAYERGDYITFDEYADRRK